jgi:hypothetical protein
LLMVATGDAQTPFVALQRSAAVPPPSLTISLPEASGPHTTVALDPGTSGCPVLKLRLPCEGQVGQLTANASEEVTAPAVVTPSSKWLFPVSVVDDPASGI